MRLYFEKLDEIRAVAYGEETMQLANAAALLNRFREQKSRAEVLAAFAMHIEEDEECAVGLLESAANVVRTSKRSDWAESLLQEFRENGL